MIPRVNARHAALAIVLLILTVPVAHTAELALPDTALFAPVARQYRARLRFVAEHRTPGDPAALLARMDAGQVDEAAAQLGSLHGDPSAVAWLRALIYLTRQQYVQAAPLIAAISKRADQTDAERMLQYQWLFAHDDAPAV